MSLTWRTFAVSGGVVAALALSAVSAQTGRYTAADDKLLADYTARWHAGDAAGLAALYDAEAITVAADGVTSGRAAIQKRFATNFAGPWKGGTIALTAGSSRTVSPDTRIVEGTYVVTGLKDASGTARPIHGRFVNTLVNRGGTWLVAGGGTFEVPTAAP
jgi:uncharacterized protein (TIGR02246 family)